MSLALDAVELLWEPDGLPAFDLPDELAARYPGSLGFDGPTLFANFVETIDGIVAIPSVEKSNALIADGSEADKFVMGLLRASADVVLVGSGTLAGSPKGTWTAARSFPPAAKAFAELRRRRGRPPEPEIAFVTARGALNVTHPRLEAGALVLTTEAGAERLKTRLPSASELVVVGPGERVDVRGVVARLHDRGHSLILSEGGPTLFGSLLAADLVDELFLTVSPLLAGHSTLGDRLALVEGAELLPGTRVGGTLAGIRKHEQHLFLRYLLR